MTRTILRVAAIVGILGLGALGVTVAVFGSSGQETAGKFIAAHLGNFGHGSSGHHGRHHSGHLGDCSHVAEVLEALDLSTNQHRQLESIHEIFGSHRSDLERLHNELLQWTTERLEQDDLTAAEIHGLVDLHLEELRAVAYQLGDEVASFAGSLDDEQRQVLVDHLQQIP